MSATRMITTAAFLVVAAMAIGIESAARREGSRVPSLVSICGFVMQYRAGRMPVGRIAIYGFWWWLGWHFFAR
jgi:DNA-binding LacI/PurR family transcriptional regulator